MCGIIAVKSNNTYNMDIIKYLLLESQIRGKHSTGVSYICNDGFKTIRESSPAKLFVENHWDEIKNDLYNYRSINLIAHTRYSTSGIPDAENAQPISDNKLSIVMNGVITQSSPDKWESEFGVKCKTTNDTEIAHIKMKNGINPLKLSKGKDDIKFSMAICALWDNGRIQFFRNGRRPQYYYLLDWNSDVSIVTSTKEITKRVLDKIGSSINVESSSITRPGEIYELTPNSIIVKDFIDDINIEDWQEN